MKDPILTPTTFGYDRVAMRPTMRTWAKHIGLLFITFVTATIAGTLFPFGMIQSMPDSDPQSWGEIGNFVLSIPLHYAAFIAYVLHEIATHHAILIYGLSFASSLLFL